MATMIVDEGRPELMAWKCATQDFEFGARLNVHESQMAVFFLDGQAVSVLGPGMHVLETRNFPFIRRFTKLRFGRYFHCEVYFVNLSVHMALPWGTRDRVHVYLEVEPGKTMPLDVGASGTMNVFSMGMLAGGADGKILGITSGGALTYTEPLTYHSLEADSVISVAISNSGNSWGCVRSDGTACLAGDVADVADVSAWENLICIKIDGTYVAALTKDGILYSASEGILASDILQFDMDGGDVAAVRSDGTIYCNNASIVFPDGWNDYSYVYVTIYNDTVYAVTEEGYVCKTSNDLLMEYTDVVAVYHGQGKLGIICSDGNFYFGNGEDMKSDGSHSGYFASFVSYQGITMRLYTTSDGSVEAMNDDFGEDAGTLKKWIRSMDDIVCPKF